MNSRLLSVIIVNYKVKYYLEQCLLSLREALEGVDAEVFVVDNHSCDGSVEYLSARFPDVNMIRSQRNLGYARANNMAIRRSEGKYVLLLNPDTIVSANTIRETLSFMEKTPDAGSCGICMHNADGSRAPESRRGLPTPLTAFYKMSGLCARYPKSRRYGHYYMGYLPWDSVQDIEVVSGAFCMLRREVLDKVGLLDEDFFMYGEDIDLSYRVKKGGYKNYYLPLTMLHYKGESTQKSSFRYVHVFYDAMLIFFRKHYSHFSWLISLPIKMAIYTKALIALIGMKIHSMKKSLGFFVGRRKKDPLYLFVGCHNEECRQMAACNALEAQFVDGDSQSLPDGHLGLDALPTTPLVVVYDTMAYSYTDILNIFASKPIPDVEVGTYNPATKVLITAAQVLANESIASR